VKYLKPNELLKVLAEAKKHGIRELTMFCLAYHHGLRCSEICKLLLTDIKDGTIDVRRLKGSLHTIQPLKSHDHPLLNEKAILSSYLRTRPDTGSQFLFVSRLGSGLSRKQIYKLFSKIAILAGVGQKGSHCLKHSLGRHMIEQGVSIAHIQQMLGHADLKATARYLSITQEDAATVADKAMQSIFA
jgi:integrase/recombinase XerD